MILYWKLPEVPHGILVHDTSNTIMFAGLYCPSGRAALEKSFFDFLSRLRRLCIIYKQVGTLTLNRSSGPFCWPRKFRGICSFQVSVCINPDILIPSLGFHLFLLRALTLAQQTGEFKFLWISAALIIKSRVCPSKALFDLWLQEMRVSICFQGGPLVFTFGLQLMINHP